MFKPKPPPLARRLTPEKLPVSPIADGGPEIRMAGRLLAFENSAGIDAELTASVDKAASVTHQTTAAAKSRNAVNQQNELTPVDVTQVDGVV